jgi:hypothetical protein
MADLVAARGFDWPVFKSVERSLAGERGLRLAASCRVASTGRRCATELVRELPRALRSCLVEPFAEVHLCSANSVEETRGSAVWVSFLWRA